MLTVENKATNFETMQHIQQVQRMLNKVILALMERAEKHDQSKLESPEVELFTEFTPKLKSSTYGSDEYNGFKKAMGPALAHHYAKNRHHPEHFENGVQDMTLIDLIEMFCDWKAATMRHDNGNLLKSIDINANRFNLSPQLVDLLKNTAELFDE